MAKLLLLFFAFLCFGKGIESNEPKRVAYVNTIAAWWPPEAIAAGMGVPGDAEETLYNHILLTFWGCNRIMDIVKIWESPTTYMGFSSKYGITND